MLKQSKQEQIEVEGEGIDNNGELLSLLKQIKSKKDTASSSVASSGCRDVTNLKGKLQLTKLLNELQEENSTEQEEDKLQGKLLKAVIQLTEKMKTWEEKQDNSGEKESKKKLVSGKTTKPDESDIKKQVKYAHEKLDPRHTKDRIFEKLNFPLLVAGELELALQDGISNEERKSRTQIARTICYHKKYLTDDDLKTGYDTILKKIEHDETDWSADLGEELHRYYDYRANVLLRERTQINNFNTNSIKNKNVSTNSVTNKEEEEDPDTKQQALDETTRIIYCMDFNLGRCSHDKSHVGKWKGKKQMKWHVCRQCLKNGELKEHKENDETCGNKA